MVAGDEAAGGPVNTDIPEEYTENMENITPPTEAQRIAGQLRQSHDDRFDCDDFDLTKREDGNEDVLVCQSCRFVVARLSRGFEGGDA